LLEIVLIASLGILVGVFTGLLPALPVYTGPFLLYQFHNNLLLESLLLFWLAVYAGSQFFGSIACITTGIPGEESSLVYIKDIESYTLSERNNLLYSTAFGSWVAGSISIVCMWLFINAGSLLDINWLFSIRVQTILFTLILLSFIIVSNNKFISLLLVLFGVIISPQNNYALPNIWYSVQWFFQGYTFYMLILGIMIIPTLFDYKISVENEDTHKAVREPINWKVLLKSSFIGIFAGLIPGPSASVGSILAYRSETVNKLKIIAAETANNSAVMASTIPFFLLALPINQNTIIMNGIMDLKGALITEVLHTQSIISNLSVIDFVCISLFIIMALYYLLSTSLIDFYVKLIVLLHKKIKLILICILTGLIYLDLQTAEITVLNYFILLGIFTFIGFLIKSCKVSPVPLLFAVLLGNKVIWNFIQLKGIYL